VIIGIYSNTGRVVIVLQGDDDEMQADFDPAAARKIAAQILNAADEAEQTQ
jgi:hypothetical protein